MNTKFTLAALLLLGILLSSCTKADDSQVVTETFDLDAFTGIDLSIAADVLIIEGTEQKVEVMGPMLTVSKISKNVRSGAWDISLPNNYNRSYKDLTINISSNNISTIDISGSGSIIGEHTLPLTLIDISGSGKINARTETTTLDCDISGSGEINISGLVNSLNLSISGSGKFEGFGLESKNSDVEVSGSGTSKVFVTDNLDASISGSGKIYYKGSPSITENISGSGQLIDAN